MKTRRARMILVTVGVVILTVAAGLLFVGNGASAERVGVTVRANLERRLTIAAGTPVELEVSLGSAPGSATFTLGGWFRPWHAYVHLEQPRTAGAEPLPVEFVAAATTALESGEGGSRVLSSAGRVAHMDGGRQVHTATFFIPPGATTEAVAGDYHVRAIVERPRWQFWGWRGRAVSAPVTITVRASPDGRADAQALEAQRLRLTAKYYLSIGQPAEARTSADALVALQPDRPSPLILLGDVLVEEQRPREGLDAYRRAMALLPPSSEPPVLLQRRIDALMRPDTSSTSVPR